MKNIVLILLLLTYIEGASQILNEGDGYFDNTKVNAFSIRFTDDANLFLLSLHAKLGQSDFYQNKPFGQGLEWKNIKIKKVGDSLIIRSIIFQVNEVTQMFISCTDKQYNDVLTPKSKTQKGFKNFLSERIDFMDNSELQKAYEPIKNIDKH